MKSLKPPATYNDWCDWHASIDPERESLLLHEDKPRLVAEETLVDMFKASCEIQWDDLVERLRDVESPTSLFDGHEALMQQTYTGTTVIRVIPAIALIAVSLNNYVASRNLPFKFCWSHVPLSSGEGDLFMAFEAWSREEQENWMSISPGYRAKRCTVWESTIRDSSQAIRIPYTRRKKVSFLRDGNPAVDSGKITWVVNCSGGRESDDGELFIEGHKVHACRGQCMTSENTYNEMRRYYLSSNSSEPWNALQRKALAIIYRERRASLKYTTSFWRRVQEKIDGTERIPAMVKK